MRFFFLVSVLMLASSSFAVELEQATNQQLLNEVSRRMGTQVSEANVTYICSDYSMNVETTSAKTSVHRSFNMGDVKQCQEQAKILVANRSHITRLTTAAICSDDNLNKLTLKPDGSMTVSTVYVGNYDGCFSQARQINESF